MSKARKFYRIASALCASVAASAARAEANKVVIGDIEHRTASFISLPAPEAPQFSA